MYSDNTEISVAVRAKPIIEDKFWIVEHAGERIATLRKDATGKLQLSTSNEKTIFNEKQELIEIFGKEFFQEKESSTASTVEYVALGFPTSVEPHKVHADLATGIPIFSKSQTSQVRFAAGFYTIKFNNGWVPSFCPKLSTLEQNEFKGPFRTEIESRLSLAHAKSN